MGVRAHLLWAAASDMGRRRTNNEDRYYADPERGIFAVIDGVGGHAAGEQAAAVAVEVLRERLERESGTVEDRLREAIALANNEICRLAKSRAEWNGMACVLTVALIEEDVVTVGHVGDSRLYLLRPGEIRKITQDHSPVGEREDRGEITEAEAMRHPRRNEIYRDVGSEERAPDAPSFIDIHTFPMPPDGAILLCTDGLSDLVSSAEIRAGMERYAPDPDAAIHALIEAANQAGGKDNITVVAVAAPGYGARPAVAAASTPVRGSRARRWAAVAVGALAGLGAGVLAHFAFVWFAASGPRSIVAGQDGINAALNRAHAGDTVLIPPGPYTEQVRLREGVTLRAQQAGTVILISPNGGPAVFARKIDTGSIEGVWVQGNLEAPARAGIEIVDASPTISNVRITGMQTGISIAGASAPTIRASRILYNLGAGVEIGANAKPKIEDNLIAANGNGKPGPDKPGIEVQETARPVIKDNGIVNNAAEPVWLHGREFREEEYRENFYGELSLKDAIHLVQEVPDPPARPAHTPNPTARPTRGPR